MYPRTTVLIFIFHLFWPSLLSEVLSYIDIVTTDYCRYSCTLFDKVVHNVACTCRISNKGIEIEPDIEFRTFIVDMHNHLRNKIASGYLEEIANYPSASNMNAMSYRLELEYLARCHVMAGGEIYDKCGRTKKYSNIGQVIGLGSTPFRSLAYMFNKMYMVLFSPKFY